MTTGITDFRGGREAIPTDPLGGIVEFGTNSEKIFDAVQYDEPRLWRWRPQEILLSSPLGATSP